MKSHSRLRARLAVLATMPLLAACGSSFWEPPAVSPRDIPRLEASLAAGESDPATASRLAQAYRTADRLEDARSVLERTLERHPEHGTATLLLGLTYEDLRRFADARRVYRAYLDGGDSAELRDEIERRLPLLQRRELQATVRQALAREAQLAQTPPQPFSVAVFPFEFVGEDPQLEPLGRAMAELMVTDLSQTSRIQVLERAQVQMLLDEMELTERGVVDPATAARTGRILGAERVVQGSMAGGESELQLETAIVRVTDSAWPGEEAPRQELLQLSESDRLAELIDMQKRLALRIYSSLGVELTPAERERVTQRPTENVMALVAFGRGLEAEDAGRFAEAAAHFAEAAGLDPAFTAARSSQQRATETEEAESVDTDELAAQADTDTGASTTAAEDQFFLPDPVARDASAEILGTEGVGSPTILELIFRRPGGTP